MSSAALISHLFETDPLEVDPAPVHHLLGQGGHGQWTMCGKPFQVHVEPPQVEDGNVVVE